jgi:ATP-dependent DNA helicase RecG
VLVLSVARRREGFAQTSDGRVLERRDAMNLAVIGEGLAELVRRRELARFKRTSTGRPLGDPDPACIDALATAYGWNESVEQRLVENGFAVVENGQLTLIVARALYLLVDPGDALGKSYVDIFR